MLYLSLPFFLPAVAIAIGTTFVAGLSDEPGDSECGLLGGSHCANARAILDNRARGFSLTVGLLEAGGTENEPLAIRRTDFIRGHANSVRLGSLFPCEAQT